MTGETFAAAQEGRKIACPDDAYSRRGLDPRTIPTAAEEDLSLGDVVRELGGLPLTDLREEWKAAHPRLQLPDKLPRDLMVRSIAWAIQRAQHGGLPSATERALDKMSRQIATTGTLEIERSVRPKPGTRLIRDWRGRTYVVEVSDDGFTHDEQIYSSLSHVARAITGTRCSGPRFFGLRPEDVQVLEDERGGGRR